MPAKKRSSKKTGATRSSEQGVSSATWLVVGVLVAAFVSFLIYLDNIPAEGENQTATTPRPEKQPVQPSKTAIKEKHQFDFYTVLPDREVEVNTVVNKQPDKKVTQKPPVTEAKKVTMTLYQLQVGAFKELSKADAMKARLAFIGVESNIQVIHSKGQKMYRVRVGPSTDAEKINHIKQQLKAQNISTFVQKLNG